MQPLKIFDYDPSRHEVLPFNSGKQGTVGIIYDKKDETAWVYKISTGMNMIATHEYKIMQSLEPVIEIVPFFTKSYTLMNAIVNEDTFFMEEDDDDDDDECNVNERDENPFNVHGKRYKYITDVHFFEYVKESHSLMKFVCKRKQVDDHIITSLLQQALFASLIAYRMIKFTHYDTHISNILVQKCCYDNVFFWKHETNCYVIPTFGYIPRFIDYGFSYTDNACKNQPMITCPLAFMKEGYFSVHPDQFADMRILCINILEDLYKYRENSDLFSILKDIIKTFFMNTEEKKQNIDWKTGWFVDKKQCANRFLFESMRRIPEYKNMLKSSGTLYSRFYEFLYCLQMLTDTNTIIENNETTSNLTIFELFEIFMKAFKIFYRGFVQFEHIFEYNKNIETEYDDNPIMGLYIIRKTIDFIVETRHLYINKETTGKAIVVFKNLLFDMLRENKKHVRLPTIDYDRYIASFYVMNDIYRILLAREYKYRKEYVKKCYDNLPSCMEDVLYIFNQRLSCTLKYKYNENTKIFWVDDTLNKTRVYALSQEQCDTLNNITDATTVASSIYNMIENAKHVDETMTITRSIFDIMKDNSMKESPDKKVEMNEWNSDSDNESSDEDESDSDEEFRQRYNWELDTPGSLTVN